MYIKCLAHSKHAVNVNNLSESQDWDCFYCIWSQKDESSSAEGNEVAMDSVHCLKWMRKCQLCGRSVFPFDQGTSLFFFISLPWFREAIGGKFSSRVTCFKREKHSFLSLRKSVQLQKPHSFLCYHARCKNFKKQDWKIISDSCHLFPGFTLYMSFLNRSKKMYSTPMISWLYTRRFYLCV